MSRDIDPELVRDNGVEPLGLSSERDLEEENDYGYLAAEIPQDELEFGI